MRAVLFDLDGTLVDTAYAQRAALAAVATSATGLRIRPDDLPPGAAADDRDHVLRQLGVGKVDEAAWDAAVAASTLDAEPFPFALRLLERLRERGTAVGIVTSRSRRRVPWVFPEPHRKLIDVMVCCDDAPLKPAPDGILLALRQLGASPSEAVYVGDQPTDIEAARAADTMAVGVEWGFAASDQLKAAGADLVLALPADLQLLLTNRESAEPWALTCYSR